MTCRAAFAQRISWMIWRREIPRVVVCGLLAACDSGETRDEPHSVPEIHDETTIELWGREYLDSRSFRRLILEQSLNVRQNGYARLRLNNYGVSGEGADSGWELLPELSGAVRPFIQDDGSETPFEPVPLLAADWTRADLYTLGQWAFERYPVQLDGAAEVLWRQNEDLTWWGMTRDDEAIWHPEIREFLQIRRPTSGDMNRKALNIHHAIVITDEFMKAVENDGVWHLLSPKDKSIIDTLNARELWIEIITMRLETGEPYLIFIDTVNVVCKLGIHIPNAIDE